MEQMKVLEVNYGKKELSVPELKNLLSDKSDFNRRFWHYAYQYRHSNDGFFDRCCNTDMYRFLKKNSFIHVQGEFKEDNPNEFETFIFKSAKTDKMGLFELWPDHTLKKVLVPMAYDTIVYNYINTGHGQTWVEGHLVKREGLLQVSSMDPPLWTIAIGYDSDGTNKVYLNTLKLEPDCYVCDTGAIKIVEKSIPFDSLFFTIEPRKISTYIGAKEDNQYFLYNPFMDTFESAKYDNLDYLWDKSAWKELANGVVLNYDESGNIRLKRTPLDSSASQFLIEGFRPNGAIRFNYTEKDKRINGAVIHYHENGEISSTAYYKLNSDTLQVKEFYADNTLKSLRHYKNPSGHYGITFLDYINKFSHWDDNDVKIGREQSYYPNGQLREEKTHISSGETDIYWEDEDIDNLTGDYRYYYANGKPMAYGTFGVESRGYCIEHDSYPCLKHNDWTYYSPFGEECDELYIPKRNIQFKFPGRDFVDTNYYVVYSNEFNRAILFTHRYNPPLYELWDTKNKLQLESDLKLDISLRGGNTGFISPTRIWGYHKTADVCQGYVLTSKETFINDSLCWNNPNNFEFSKRLNQFKSSDGFDPEELPVSRKVSFNTFNYNNTILYAGSHTGNFKIDLSNGKLHLFGGEIDHRVDSIRAEADKNQERVYAAYLSTLKHEAYIDIIKYWYDDPIGLSVKNTPDSLNIFIYEKYEDQGMIMFENQKKNGIEQYVFLETNQDGAYLFRSLDSYYMGSKNIKDVCYFTLDDEPFLFEQFDLKYNRPDIILDRLGYADPSLIQAYYHAYQKRLKKMGFTEDMLEDDFHLPEIEIEYLEELPSMHDEESINLKLKLQDSKYKLDRINVWVNDVAIYGTDGISLRDKDVQEFSTELEVFLAKGNNKVQVSVLNQAGAESFKESFEIECTAGKDQPDLYLIAIGASAYQQSDYNLTYAAKDAEDVVDLFEDSKLYNNVYSTILINEEVTIENVMSLDTFLNKPDINDEVVIFIAGHGVLDDQLDYYFATYDMDFGKPSERGLPYEDLESILDGIKPLKKILMIDACHAGEVDKESVVLAANEEETVQASVAFRGVVPLNVRNKKALNAFELMKSTFSELRLGTGATVISSSSGLNTPLKEINGTTDFSLIA